MVGAAGPAEQRGATVAAHQRRGQVEHVAVDQAGAVEGACRRRPALDEQLEHPAPAELVEHVRQLARQLEAGMHLRVAGHRAQHDPQRVPALDVAHGERWIVGTDGAGPDQDRVAVGPQLVGVGPRLLAR